MKPLSIASILLCFAGDVNVLKIVLPCAFDDDVEHGRIIYAVCFQSRNRIAITELAQSP